MLSFNVKIGLVPIRRDVTPRPGIFNWEKAEIRCNEAVEYIENNFSSRHVDFVDLKELMKLMFFGMKEMFQRLLIVLGKRMLMQFF